MRIISTTLIAIVSATAISSQPTPEVPEIVLEPAPVEEVAKEVTMVDRWILPGANYNESRVLEALQDRGITDRAALATVMGNIKQESRFISNICEGGARVNYWSCTRGGYGLIQWTTHRRYRGLWAHSQRMGLNPESVEAQISYLFTEPEWRGIESSLRIGGRSIQYYMNRAYFWLGWGHHGYRTEYSWDYYNRLTIKSVPAK